MKTKALIGSILMTAAALAVASPVFAGDASESALKAAVPNGSFKQTKTDTVNNVKLETYSVSQPNVKEWYETLTENGDVMATARPCTPADLPPAVTEVSSTLFGKAPSSIWRLEITEYDVNVKTANETYLLKINAAGVMTGILTGEELKYANTAPGTAASAAEAAGLDKLVAEEFPGAKVVAVNHSPVAPGFYIVEFNAGAQHGYIQLNKDNRIRGYSIVTSAASLPKPVTAALADIKGAQVVSVLRNTYRRWDVSETVGSDTVDLHVRPDGSILDIDSEQGKAVKAATKSK